MDAYNWHRAVCNWHRYVMCIMGIGKCIIDIGLCIICTGKWISNLEICINGIGKCITETGISPGSGGGGNFRRHLCIMEFLDILLNYQKYQTVKNYAQLDLIYQEMLTVATLQREYVELHERLKQPWNIHTKNYEMLTTMNWISMAIIHITILVIHIHMPMIHTPYIINPTCVFYNSF